MRLIEWEVSEDGYEEQIIIPKENVGHGDVREIVTYDIHCIRRVECHANHEYTLQGRCTT